MAGCVSGVQARLQAEQPKAMFVHCTAHSLNLAIQDSVRAISLTRDAIDYTKEINGFMTSSAKREDVFSQAQLELTASDKADHSAASGKLRKLNPTSWAERVKAVRSLLRHYKTVKYALSICSSESTDAGRKASGLHEVLSTFKFFFGLMLIEKVLEPVETLSSILQSPHLSLNEAKSAVANVTKILTAFRTGRSFAALWQDCLSRLADLDVKEPQTPRVIRPPKKTDAASDTVHSFSSAEEFYRQGYYEIIDALITQIEVRFDQKTFKLYQSIENLILSAATSGGWSRQDFENVTAHFNTDIDALRLQNQLNVLPELMKKQQTATMQDVINEIKGLGQASRLYSEVGKLIRLFLVIPPSSALAERSFSSLRRLKTYLRSTNKAERLNSIAILHTHHDHSPGIDLRNVGNIFILKNSKRKDTFCIF